MQTILLTVEEMLKRLREGPPRIAALTASLTPAQLRTSPDEGWSATHVLAHLRACGDVWGGHILRILAEDRPEIRGISPRTWMKKTDYPDLEFRRSFDAFARQRAGLLAALEPLPPDSWERTAVVKAYGQVQENNVLFYADGLARHERPHIRQIQHIAEALQKRS
jgi:DinB superfamily